MDPALAQLIANHEDILNSINVSSEITRMTPIISHLPQDVHRRILSLLSIKDAVCTSVLAKSWRHVWKLLRTFDLDAFRSRDNSHFEEFAERVLCDRDDQGYCLDSLTLIRSRCDPVFVARIIQRAYTLRLIKLTLNFQYLHACSNLSSASLTSLCVWNPSYKQHQDFPNSLDLPSLTSLSLMFVNFRTDAEVATPFSSFEKLEKLRLDGCIALSKRGSILINNPRLDFLALDVSHDSIVIIRTPKLKAFDLVLSYMAPRFPLFAFNSESLSSVNMVDVHFASFLRTDTLMVMKLLKSFLNIRTLTITWIVVEALLMACDSLSNASLMMENLELIQIKKNRNNNYFVPQRVIDLFHEIAPHARIEIVM